MKPRKEIKNIKPYIPGKLKAGAIKLASNENPLGPSPKGIEAIKDYADKVSLYPDGSCMALKGKIAERFGVVSEQIVTGNGSDEILLFIAGAYISEGDNAITSETTFSEYTFATTLFGGKMKYAPMKDGKYQLTEMLKLVDDKTRTVFIANPNNPTGSYVNKDEFIKFMAGISKDVLVVVDEAYREYVRAENYPETLELLAKYKNLLILRTFSKIYGLAGLRVGYGIGDPEIITMLNKAREPFNVNSVGQIAATAALDDYDFVMKSIKINEEGKEFLYKTFDEMGLKYYQTEGNFIFVYINQDCMEAFEQIMDLGVTIRPMKSFGINDAIRVTVGTQEQNEKFVDCLKKVL